MYFAYFFAALAVVISGYSAIITPQVEKSAMVARADAMATDLLAWRRSVIEYHKSNLSFTGSVASGDLAAYAPYGNVVIGDWNNFIDPSGNIFVWSNTAVGPETKESLYQKLNGSLTLGVNFSGELRSIRNQDTGIILPPIIPDGVLVIMGS